MEMPSSNYAAPMDAGYPNSYSYAGGNQEYSAKDILDKEQDELARQYAEF